MAKRTFAVTMADRALSVTIDPKTPAGRKRFVKVLRDVADWIETRPVPVRVYRPAKRGARRTSMGARR